MFINVSFSIIVSEMQNTSLLLYKTTVLAFINTILVATVRHTNDFNERRNIRNEFIGKGTVYVLRHLIKAFFIFHFLFLINGGIFLWFSFSFFSCYLIQLLSCSKIVNIQIVCHFFNLLSFYFFTFL